MGRAINIALGAGATGVFTTSDHLWREMDEAGWKTDSRVNCLSLASLVGPVGLTLAYGWDQVWRMPLFASYRKQIKSAYADLKNNGGRPAGSCTAALFLSGTHPAVFLSLCLMLTCRAHDGSTEFVETSAWMHMDIAGVMYSDDVRALLALAPFE